MSVNVHQIIRRHSPAYIVIFNVTAVKTSNPTSTYFSKFTFMQTATSQGDLFSKVNSSRLRGYLIVQQPAILRYWTPWPQQVHTSEHPLVIWRSLLQVHRSERPMHVTYPAHPISLDLFVVTRLDDECKWECSLLCDASQPLVDSSLSEIWTISNFFLSTGLRVC
jgi:hypothetical protein